MSRPRGFITWKPQAKNRALVASAQAIIAAYKAYGPMTVRQIFYRLVATENYLKTENAYKSLAETLQKARRARMIDFDDIRDDGDTKLIAGGYDGIIDLMYGIDYIIENYTLRGDIGQPKHIVVMTEAAGMAPMIAQTAHRYGITVMSSGGFGGVTGKQDLAKHIARTWRAEERQTVVLHMGDYDPSGTHIYSNLEEDVTAFLDDMIGNNAVALAATFERIAVTEEQVISLNLPTAPAKKSDNRSFDGIDGDGTSTVQCEAIDPATLSRIVETAILRHWDPKIAQALRKREVGEKKILQDWRENAGDPETA